MSHIHVHCCCDSELRETLQRIERKIDAMHEEFNAVIKRIDEATNAIADEIKALKDQISGGLSADEAGPILATLDSLAGKLETIGHDPNNPVP